MSDVPMSQYKDLYVQTGKQYLETLNNNLLLLEKEPENEAAVAEIFRAAHSLKGQSAAMGYSGTGYLCHVIEDVFYEVKEKRRQLDSNLADLIFQSLDALSQSVAHIEADGTELNVEDMGEKIKSLAGTDTSGVGHSVHAPDWDGTKANMMVAAVAEKPDAEASSLVAADTFKGHAKQIKTIPVKVSQLDDIVNSLEELMVEKLALRSAIEKIDNSLVTQAEAKVDRLIELIHYQVMKIRTVPLTLIFDHVPRAVRDLGRALNKQIELCIEGGELELDRSIVEKLDEPITHLIRNAADHGIGEQGTITISAHPDKDFAVVAVGDDGAGIDWSAIAEKAHIDLQDSVALGKALFSGLTTSSNVSLISGRGVGLKAVKKTVEDLGGTIEVTSSPGQGTTFTMRLPLSVSVMKVLIVIVGLQRYAISVALIERSIKIQKNEIFKNIGQEVIRYDEQEIPLVRLSNIFDKRTIVGDTAAVIVKLGEDRLALAVDSVTEILETVIRPLHEVLKFSDMFSGVTIVGDGTSVLLINPRGFMK